MEAGEGHIGNGGNVDGQGPQALSTETCRCCTRTLSQCLESASQWASPSVTQLQRGVLQHPCPVTRCQPPWGREAGAIPGRDLGLTSPADGGSLLALQQLPGMQGCQIAKQMLGDFCTPPTFLLLGCARQCGGQELCFCGHRAWWPHSLALQPAPAVPASL